MQAYKLKRDRKHSSIEPLQLEILINRRHELYQLRDHWPLLYNGNPCLAPFLNICLNVLLVTAMNRGAKQGILPVTYAAKAVPKPKGRYIKPEFNSPKSYMSMKIEDREACMHTYAIYKTPTIAVITAVSLWKRTYTHVSGLGSFNGCLAANGTTEDAAVEMSIT